MARTRTSVSQLAGGERVTYEYGSVTPGLTRRAHRVTGTVETRTTDYGRTAWLVRTDDGDLLVMDSRETVEVTR